MALTRLGWDVITSSSDDRLVNFPYVSGKVRKGDAYTILAEFARRFDAEVEPIVRAKSWGWAHRAVRGASVISEHAAGTAVDFNAPDHWLGEDNTFSDADEARIHALLREFDGVIRWGGDYSGRLDEMHFELQGGVKKLAEVASKIQQGKGTIVTPPTKSTPSHSAKAYPAVAVKRTSKHTVASDAAYRELMFQCGYLKDKRKGALTPAIQLWLTKVGEYDGIIDLNFGPLTVKALQRFLKRKGLYKGAIDGKRGAMTVKAEIDYLNTQRKFLI